MRKAGLKMLFLLCKQIP